MAQTLFPNQPDELGDDLSVRSFGWHALPRFWR